MNAATVHLLVNHFPPIVGISALIVIVWGAISGNAGTRRAGYFLVWIAAVTAILTFTSGRGAEHVVKGMEGINHAAIGPHEEAAGATFILFLIAMAFAIVAMIKPSMRWAHVLVLAFLVLATLSSVYTAMLGGRVHHPETQMRRR